MGTDITLDPAQGQTLEAWAKAIPGDAGIVRLAPGDHGRPVFTGRRTSRIDIWGQPGAVVRGALFRDTSRWLFRRVKFQPASLAPPNAYYAAMVDTDALSSDISFGYSTLSSACDFSACDDISAVPATERPLLQGMLLRLRGRNMAATFSTFHDCRTAIQISGSNNRVEGCVVERFTVDGIGFDGAGHQIVGNTVRDARHHIEEREHCDGIQGYQAGGRDCVVARNVVGPSPLSDYMQGISGFDGMWTNLTVEDNDVTPSGAYHGITWFGPDGVMLQRNTVRQDRPGFPPRIQITKAKDGRPAANVVERDNIAPQIMIDAWCRLA